MTDKANKWLIEQKKNVNDMEYDLLNRAVKVLTDNTAEGTDYPWSPCRCILPAKDRFDGIWNWDSAFHAMATSRWDAELAMDCILAFVRFQEDNGMFPDVIFSDGIIVNQFSKPPVLAWAAEIVYRRCGNTEFLKTVYPIFVKNEQFWRNNRCYEGMFFYDAQDKEHEEYDKHVRFETGWDNSPRWDEPAQMQWAIDLNCYMVMFYRSMKYFAEELGLREDEQKWTVCEKKLAELIEEKLWDNENKYYSDVNKHTGKSTGVLTPACFMPLFIEIASREHSEHMNCIAGDKNKFYSGMPSVAYDNPCYSTDYWRGPTWLNIAYFAAKGLKNYGFETADKIRDTILLWCDRDKQGIYENYNSSTGEGLYCDHFSWSAAFIIEFILNF